ncbi:MAG: isochorismatase family protein [Actinobacteria bacterium]|nr:isochorismatase family protein [Actinomycetota bacterium]
MTDARGTYDQRTALIVVDTQNDFADPDGSLYVNEGEETVPEINAEIAAAREAGALIVYTQDWHPESTPHFEKDGGVWPVHCVQDTWGAEFHPYLAVDGAAPVVRKGSEGGDGYSGFSVRDPESGDEHATRLDSILKERDTERVVVVGLAQDYCVKETTVDAATKGYDTTMISDATRAVNMEPGDDEEAAAEMTDAGAKIA